MAAMTCLSTDFLRTVGRHFVTLSCVQTLPGIAKEKVLVFSGFLVDVSGVWLYVTAGHILKDIKSALDAGAQFDIWRLDDQTAGNRFKGAAIPFEFDVDRWLVIEDPDAGLDYAVVVLDRMYCLQLGAGGVVPIDKTAWGDHVTEFDHWAMIGIPSETVVYDDKTLITARIVVAPLEPTNPPAGVGQKAENQFFAKLKSDPVGFVNDIDGMSGGPIFALKKIGEEWKYSIIGVQSGWYPRARIVAACPFSSLGFALELVVESALSSTVTNNESHTT